jgi:hypothetical protein
MAQNNDIYDDNEMITDDNANDNAREEKIREDKNIYTREKKNKKMYKYQEINDEGEEIKKYKGIKNPHRIPKVPFVLKEQIDQLLASPLKVNKIVGHYIQKKDLKFENWEQWAMNIYRYIAEAKKLTGYNSDQIEKTFEYCTKKWPEDWKLETVTKWVADVNK